MARSDRPDKRKIDVVRRTRNAIHAASLKRRLPSFAEHRGLDVNELTDLADRQLYLCALCIGPVATPRLYYVDGKLRAIICGRCEAAIDKLDGHLFYLSKHRRFNTDYVKNRGRLARFITLHSTE